MKWLFENKPVDELTVCIQKSAYDQEVADLVTYLGDFQTRNTDVISVKTSDDIVILKLSDLRAVEVDGNYLVIYYQNRRISTRQRLYQFKEKVGSQDMIQVSKQSLINIRHLERMEASFSGNMTAFLTGGLKIAVSRRYLKALEERLGL
ncbi:LytTR family DNA-binding domain-containing protein [Streptococcus pluranimalium]